MAFLLFHRLRKRTYRDIIWYSICSPIQPNLDFSKDFLYATEKKNLNSNMYSALNYCLGLLIYIGMQCSKYTNQTHTNNHIMTLSASRVILPSTVGMLRCFGFFFFSLFTFHSLTFVYRVLDDLIVGLHLPLSIVKHCWHCIWISFRKE